MLQIQLADAPTMQFIKKCKKKVLQILVVVQISTKNIGFLMCGRGCKNKICQGRYTKIS